MIRVTVENVPVGREQDARPIGVMEIANTGALATDGFSEYVWRIWDPTKTETQVRVSWTTGPKPPGGVIASGTTRHDRPEGVWKLLKRALDALD